MRIVIAALMLVLVSVSSNAEDKTGFTVAPMIGATLFADGIDNDNHWSLGLGYQFDNPWAVEFVYADVGADIDPGVGKVDVNRWHLDGLYRFNREDALRPYLSFGIGRGEYDFQPGLSVDETLFNAGAGVKWAFAENTSLRGEIKAFDGRGIDRLNFALSVGIHHVFGAKAVKSEAPAMVAMPAPKRMDSDNDGVFDDEDSCKMTPAKAPIDARGCPLDSDGDGVFDYLDQCPNTTDRAAKIDTNGCYVMLKEQVKVELNAIFDNNSAAARPEHRAEVARVYEFMRQYPMTRVTVEGHTDSRGSAEYNKDLSQRRAQTIADLLVSEFGVDARRVSAAGYGEERPIASNETAEGRQQNRRVVGVVEAIVEVIQEN